MGGRSQEIDEISRFSSGAVPNEELCVFDPRNNAWTSKQISAMQYSRISMAATIM